MQTTYAGKPMEEDTLCSDHSPQKNLPKCWECTSYIRDDYGGYCRRDGDRLVDGSETACGKFTG